jgi:hypothetical protein
MKMCTAPPPVNIKAPSGEGQIRSVGYDRSRDSLEFQFTWTYDVRQFYPVSPVLYRQLLTAKPMYLFLHQILKPRGVRFQYVRTEAKRAIMLELLGVCWDLNSD